MTIYVFVGAGPANLHRALKVRKINRDAQIVIIDNRLDLGTSNFDRKGFKREEARANIFRFETDDVTRKLIEDGVDEDDLMDLMHQREFSVNQGFQRGDDTVFSDKPFSQIQIRDLQQILLDTLLIKGNIELASQKLDTSSPEVLQNQVINYLQENGFKDTDIHIHAATGALRGDKEDEIIYPDKATHHIKDTTADVAAMPVVPVHGTVTFFIKDEHGQQIISCNELQENQRSLDLTNWQEPLRPFGWKLVRPPRIRVFYANDILYIGAEIPMSMNNENERAYKNNIAAYTRQIAQLVFPNLPIEDLNANEVLRSRFPTGRGEAGQVITRKYIKKQKINVTLFNNGDSRYLPHYQTGSGFVTGFLQNELYADIYQHRNLKELLQWAKTSAHLSQDDRDALDEQVVINKYEQIILLALKEELYAELSRNIMEENQKNKLYVDIYQYTNSEELLQWAETSAHLSQDAQNIITKYEDEQFLLRIFQQELYIALSRDIIEHNKEKVGRYFNALHEQTLYLLPEHFNEFFSYFNKSSSNASLTTSLSNGLLDKRFGILAMLKTGNLDFLKKALPRLLNMDFSQIDDKQFFHLRNVLLEDLERNLPQNLLEQLNEYELSTLQTWWVKHQNKLKIAASVSLTVIGGLLGTFLIPIPGLGSVLGGVVGGAIGAGTGLGLGLTGAGFLELIRKNPTVGTALTAVGSAGLGAGIGAILGTIVFPGIGTAIGAAIGAGVGLSAGLAVSGLANFVLKNPKTATALTTAGSAGLGAGVGALLGTLVFPGVGTLIGAAIGAGVGASASLFATGIYNAVTKYPVSGVAMTTLGSLGIGAFLGTLVLPGIGTAVGAVIGVSATLLTAGVVKVIQLFRGLTTVDMNPIPIRPGESFSSSEDDGDPNKNLRAMIVDLGIKPQNNLTFSADSSSSDLSEYLEEHQQLAVPSSMPTVDPSNHSTQEDQQPVKPAIHVLTLPSM